MQKFSTSKLIQYSFWYWLYQLWLALNNLTWSCQRRDWQALVLRLPRRGNLYHFPCLNVIFPFYPSLLNNCNCCFLQRTLSQRCWELPRVQLHRQGFEKHPENQFSKNRQFHSFQPMIEFLSCIHIHSEGEDLNEISKTKSIRMVSTLCGMSSTDKWDNYSYY